MEEMGKQMIKHCGGLPLAIKVLGGLLAAQYVLHEWKRIYENIGSFIIGGTSVNDKNISSVYHILSMSFEELPIYLKHCFLYLSHFPEDYPIDLGVFSYYLAAEGMPIPRYYDGSTIQEVANGYIVELVKRNMVISKRDVQTSRFEKCQLHDMMREVCLLKAEEENFLQTIDAGDSTSSEKYSRSPCKSRRLAITHSQAARSYRVTGNIKDPKLRSLLFFNQIVPTFNQQEVGLWFTRLHLLKVLDLSRAWFEGGKLPSSIGKLIHLRYLSLYRSNVSNLPSTMWRLRQILYLNICVSTMSLIYMPNFLEELVELRYHTLPYEMKDKTKLELGSLINLETLENFSTKHSSVRDLQGMTRLRTLSILFDSVGCDVETLSSSLSRLSHFENLYINDHTVYGPMNDEEGIFLDCIHLTKLKLSIRLPNEQNFPSCLTCLDLSNCCLEEDLMPNLGKLVHLYEVNLLDKSFCGKKMVCLGGGFPQLQKLNFDQLDDWEEWIVEESTMPLLHTLSVKRCKKLKEVPDGLRFITSLKEVTIVTSEREFKEKLSRGGEEYYKIQHIPVLKIDYTTLQ